MVLGPILYKCEVCGWQTRKERENLTCPDCEGNLVRCFFYLDEPGNFLPEGIYEKFPCVLAHEYKRLSYLAKSGNIYGTFLQLKDVIEVIIKLPVLIGLAWGKMRNVEGREAYEKKLSKSKLSLGTWVETADAIQKVFKSEAIRNTDNAMPLPVWSLLKDLHDWVEKNKLTKWRNLQLAHGALALEDDEEFKQETIRIIRAVTEYVNKKQVELSKIKIISDKIELKGSSSARHLISCRGDCGVKIDNITIPTSPFIIHYKHGIFFYDELLSEIHSRILSYPMGQSERYHDDYILALSKLQGEHLIASDNDMESDFVTRAELDFVNRIGCKNDFIEPEYISDWLREFLKNNDKGIFLLEMERGCGKTYYTEMLNRRHQQHIELVDDLDVRTYHISWTQNRGLDEFVDGIEAEWRFAYDKIQNEDIALSAHIRANTENPEKNAAALCRYLEKVRDYTMRTDARQRKSRILLVLDGLDEISDSNDYIWSFIPQPSMLSDDVYILLTGRLPSEEIPGKYSERLSDLETTDRKIVHAKDSNNTEILRRYIQVSGTSIANIKTEDEIIEYADYRFLPMRMLCNNLNYSHSIDISTEGGKATIAGYIQWIVNLYGDCRKEMIDCLLAILSLQNGTIRLTLREIADLLSMGGIKWELIGLLSDFSPMLMIYRNNTLYGQSYLAENNYQLANRDVAEAVKMYLGKDRYIALCSEVLKSAIETLPDVKLDSRSDGRLALLADLRKISFELEKEIWVLEQLPAICQSLIDKQSQVAIVLNNEQKNLGEGKKLYLIQKVLYQICILFRYNLKINAVKYSNQDLYYISEIYGILLFLMNCQNDKPIDELKLLIREAEYILHHTEYHTSTEKIHEVSLLGTLAVYCNNDVYDYSGLHKNALQFAKEALHILEEMKNLPDEQETFRQKMMSNLKNTLAVSYRHSGSIEDLKAAKEILLDLISNACDDDQMMGNYYLNLGSVISDMGGNLEEVKSLYMKSIEYFSKDTVPKDSSEDMQATVYENLARIYYYKGSKDKEVILNSYEKAIQHTKESIKYIPGITQLAKLSRLWNDYGHVIGQFGIKNDNLIDTCIMNSLEISRKIAIEDPAYEDQVLNCYCRLIRNCIVAEEFDKINMYFDSAIESLDRLYERLSKESNSVDTEYAYKCLFSLMQMINSNAKGISSKYTRILIDRYEKWIQAIDCPINNDTMVDFQCANDLLFNENSASTVKTQKLYSRVIYLSEASSQNPLAIEYMRRYANYLLDKDYELAAEVFLKFIKIQQKRFENKELDLLDTYNLANNCFKYYALLDKTKKPKTYSQREKYLKLAYDCAVYCFDKSERYVEGMYIELLFAACHNLAQYYDEIGDNKTAQKYLKYRAYAQMMKESALGKRKIPKR